jgi:hypothetical protein
MTDLSEFLLARIAEDEDHARRLRNAYDLDLLSVPAVLVNAGALVIPGNVLAECDAKRRIVEECTSPTTERVMVRAGVYGYQPRRVVRTDDLDIAEGVLRSLAQPYAEHPDYRDEWRP